MKITDEKCPCTGCHCDDETCVVGGDCNISDDPYITFGKTCDFDSESEFTFFSPITEHSYSVSVKIKKLNNGVQLPSKANSTDACYDCFVNRIEKKSDGLYIAYLGFALDVSNGWKAVIVPRSSLTSTEWFMQNSPGQIDCSYRGEVQVRLRSIPEYVLTSFKDESPVLTVYYPDFPFKVGDRVAQMYFEPVWDAKFIETNELSDTDRADGGFGSTGK